MAHKNKNVTEQKGATLVGLLIAVVILGSTFTASTAFLVRNTRESSVARHEITASYLAEEGIELVKNVRDSADNFCLKNPANAQCAGLLHGFDSINFPRNARAGGTGGYGLDNSISTYTARKNNAWWTTRLFSNVNNDGLCPTAVGGVNIFRSCNMNSAPFIRKIQILSANYNDGIDATNIITYDCKTVGGIGGRLIVSTVFWKEPWESYVITGHNDNALWYEGNNPLRKPIHRVQVKNCVYNWRPN